MTAPPSVVTPAPAVQLQIVTRPPGGVIGAGKSFTVVTNALDPFGNVDTSYSGPVTISLASGPAGSLGGTVTVNAINGEATFSNLMATTSGQISLTAGSSDFRRLLQRQPFR